jgi:polyisoprenyl-phosphate glycosyltransferase
MAGLQEAVSICDCAVSIDADLPDEVTKIAEFMPVFKTGFDVIYGFGESRSQDSFAINNGVSSTSAGPMFEFLSLRYIENYGGLRNGYRLQIGRIIYTKSHYAPVKNI